MKLVIKNNKDYSKYFVYNYLPSYILSEVNKFYNATRASQVSRELKLDILNIFKYAVKNLAITESRNDYIISINKNLRYNKYNLKKLIDFISYGNRNIKGYRLLYDIFEATAENIDLIYKRWQDGY